MGIDIHLCWAARVCVYGGGGPYVTGSVSVSLVAVTLKLHNTTSCCTSLCSVDIVALQEASPTQHVLRHEVNNNAECSTDGCCRQSSVM